MPIHVGILLSANRWIRLLTNTLAEKLINRYDGRTLFTGAFILGILITLGYTTTPPFLLFLGLRALWGFCWSLLRHAGVMTVIGSADNGNAGKSIGIYNGIVRVGFLIGALFSGFLIDSMPMASTFLVLAAVTVIGLPFAVMTFQRGKEGTPEPSTHAGKNRRVEAQGFILGAVGSGLIMSTLGKVLSLWAGGTATTIGGLVVGIATINGILLAVRHTFGIAGSPLLGGLVDKLGTSRSGLLFFTLAAVSLLAASISVLAGGYLVLILAVLVFFLSETALYIALSTRSGVRGSLRYRRFVTASDTGSACGPIVGWLIIQLSISSAVVFFTGAGLYIIGVVLSQKKTRAASGNPRAS